MFQSEVALNQQLFIDVVHACSLYHPTDETDAMELDISMDTEQATSTEPSSAALEVIGQMLTEIISPDVLYNQIDWPEEGFARCTLERL